MRTVTDRITKRDSNEFSFDGSCRNHGNDTRATDATVSPLPRWFCIAACAVLWAMGADAAATANADARLGFESGSSHGYWWGDHAGSAFLPPPGWTLMPESRADTSGVVNVTFVLPIATWDTVVQPHLLAISSPQSPQYGDWASMGSLMQRLYLEQEAEGPPLALQQYTRALGWSCSMGRYTWECTDVPRAVLTQQWGVQFRTFVATLYPSGVVMKRTRAINGPALPPDVAATIDFVAGLGSTPPVPTAATASLTARARRKGTGAVSDTPPIDPYIVPQTIAATYALPGGPDRAAKGWGVPGTSVGVIEYQGYQSYLDTDLQQYAQGLNLPGCTFTKHVGPFDNSSGAGDESALDAAAVAGLACGSELVWLTFDNWVWDYSHFCAASPSACPNVTSSSWGWCEGAQCDIDAAACSQWNVSSFGYARRVDQELALSAGFGVTHVFASGDAGCHGRTDETCQDPACRTVFPCGSRWVTCVSATAAIQPWKPWAGTNVPSACAMGQCAASASNGPCTLNGNGDGTGCFWTPGGGISKAIPRPWYQQPAVAAYEGLGQLVLPPVGDYGAGRAVPDIAVFGHNYWLPVNGAWSTMDGTSTSTPLVAALLNAWNGVRLQQGKPLLGPVNALLYALGSGTSPDGDSDGIVFTSVWNASNACTEETCCDTGFQTQPVGSNVQWNAVTGFGTPNMTALMFA